MSIPYWLGAGYNHGYTNRSNDYISCVTNDDYSKKTATTLTPDKVGYENQIYDSAYWNDFQPYYGFERQ